MKKENMVTWESIYEHWKLYSCHVPENLRASPVVETIPVPYDGKAERFYGYDWLTQENCEARKRTIEKDFVSFLLFAHPTNKGTIHTLRMLLEAKNDEERAAIWICAYAKEIMERTHGATYRTVSQIYHECWNFLNQRFYMWHHAMKGLVPEVFTGSELLEAEYSSAYAIVELARINMAFVANAYVPVRYSSLKPGEDEPAHSVRIAK